MHRVNYWKLCLFILLLIAVVLSACTGVKQPQERSTVSPTSIKAATHTPTSPPTRTAAPMATPTPSPTATMQPPLFDVQLQKDSILGVRWGVKMAFDLVQLGDDRVPYLVNLNFPYHAVRIVDGVTGREVWSYRTQGENMLTYTWAEDLFILGEVDQEKTNQSWLRAYEFPSMRRLWEMGGELEKLEELMYDQGAVLALESRADGRVNFIHRVDITDGHSLWSVPLGGCDSLSRSDFTYIMGAIQVECGGRTLEYDLASGQQHPDPADDQPHNLNNLIHAGQGLLYQLQCDEKCTITATDLSNPKAIRQMWSSTVSRDVKAIRPYASDVVFRDRNHITRLDGASGTVVWQTEISGLVSRGLEVIGDRIFSGTEVGFVCLLDADTGELIWEQDIWGTIEPRFIAIEPITLFRDSLLVYGRSADAGWATLMLGMNEPVSWTEPNPELAAFPAPMGTATPVFTPPPLGELSAPPQYLEDWASGMLSFINADPANLPAFDRLMQSWADSFTEKVEAAISGFNTQGEIEIKPTDLTGDGLDELIVVFNANSQFFAPGLVVVLSPDGDETYRAIYNEIAYLPKLEAVADLDRDWQYEMVYSTNYYGVTAEKLTVTPLDWDGKALVAISDDPIYTTNADLVQVRNTTGDAQVEIIIHGGTNGSLAAGPVRDYTYTYSLVDGRYRLFSQEPDDADSYYFLVTDAHNAFMAGDLYEAIRMFTYALTSPEAQALIDDWGFHDEEAKHAYADPMKAFAEYQLMLAYIQKGDEDKAAEWALTGHYPDMLYSQVKTVFWNTYQQTHDWTQAAEAARTQARLAGYDAIQLLRDLGYANEGLDLEDVCPCPQCRQGSIE